MIGALILEADLSDSFGVEQDSAIYAIKGDEAWASKLYASLMNGEGRFGWSQIAEGDLHVLKDRISRDGWNSLDRDEKDTFQQFLLELKEGDWVVYINVPTWGECTVAKIKGPYIWTYSDADFNHRFPVYSSTVRKFERNDKIVHPALSARLKLQSRRWRIYTVREFEQLLLSLAKGAPPEPRTPEANAALLNQSIEPHLLHITREVHHTHPNFDLEGLLQNVFEKMPGVRRVIANGRGGAKGDDGADLIVEYESGLPISVLQTQHKCVVQIKSYKNTHSDKKAVDDIRRAFLKYPDADIGLIISTADSSTPELDEEIRKLREDSNRRVELLIGADVARLILRFGGWF